MPLGSDLNQRLVLILQKQGEENIDALKAKLNELKGEFEKAGEALATSFEQGKVNLLEFNKETADLQRHYKEVAKLLQELEKHNDSLSMEEGKAQRQRIDGWAAAYDEMDRYAAKLKAMQTAELEAAAAKIEAAREAAAEAQKAAAAQAQADTEAAGEVMRRRAELYARLERMGEELLESERQDARESLQAQKDAAGKQIRDKAELYARLERMGQEALEEERMRIGKELLARIEAHAAADRRAEQSKREDDQRRGDAILAAANRQARIDEYEEEQHRKNLARMDAEFKAAESLRNQKMLYQRLASGDLNDNQIKELKRLTETIQGVNKFTDEALEGFERIGNGMNRAEQKSKNFAMGLMAVAHAAQDAQYGFGAVVNNIPQIAYAMGNAIPSLENYAMQFSAIAMIGGTLVNIALPQIKQFVTTFATELGILSDPLRTTAVTTDQLKTKLEALQSKSWKVDMDFNAIRMAEKQISDLESRLKAWDSLAQKRTSIEDESGKRYGEAVNEAGSADAFKVAFTDALNKMGRLNLGTEAQKNLKSAQDELLELERIRKDPTTSAAGFMAANARQMWLESSLPGMRDAVRKEIDQVVGRILGGAAQGRKGNIQDVMDALTVHPESFKAQGLDMQRLRAGLMSADHDIIKDERTNEKEAKRQEDEAKREKKLRDDQTDDMNRQAAEHDAAIKPMVEGAKKRKDAVIRQWVRDNEEDADRMERNIKNAPAVAARAGRAAAAAGRRQQAEMKRFNRDLDAENKQREIGQYSEEFRNFGFAPGLANKAGEMMAQKNKANVPQQLAYAQVLDAVARMAAKQEEAVGVIGQATMLVQQLDARQRAMDQMLQRNRQALGRVGNKRRTLLQAPGQAN